jgi:hypothetical protein
MAVMREIISDHDPRFLRDMLLNSEFLLKHYIEDKRPEGEIGEAKIVGALAGYIYALGYMDMVDFADDGVTALRIKPEYKQHDHYKKNKAAKECMDYVNHYLQSLGAQYELNIYDAVLTGVEGLVKSPVKMPPEKELAGSLGVIAFQQGVLTKDSAACVDGIRGVNSVPTVLTKKNLINELTTAGALAEFLKQEREYFRKSGGGRQGNG